VWRIANLQDTASNALGQQLFTRVNIKPVKLTRKTQEIREEPKKHPATAEETLSRVTHDQLAGTALL